MARVLRTPSARARAPTLRRPQRRAAPASPAPASALGAALRRAPTHALTQDSPGTPPPRSLPLPRVPVVLRVMGVLRYSDALAAKVGGGQWLGAAAAWALPHHCFEMVIP